jgi:hypothetical protein
MLTQGSTFHPDPTQDLSALKDYDNVTAFFDGHDACVVYSMPYSWHLRQNAISYAVLQVL